MPRENVYSGLRVVELTDFYASYCGKQLAAFGAEVTKIEPLQGERTRQMGPFAGGAPHPEKSLLFAYMNTGKHSVTLDLETEVGREELLRRLKTADVFIETTTPGTLESWGLDYAALEKLNPGLVMDSVTPFGQTGPHSHWKAPTDFIIDAMGGPMYEMRKPGRAPLHLGYDILGPSCSMIALVAIQAALRRRLETSRGAYIDLSLQECMFSYHSDVAGYAQVTEKDAEPPEGHGLIPCRDGIAYLFIGGKWDELLDWMDEMGLETAPLRTETYDRHRYDVLAAWDDVLNSKLQQLGALYTKTGFMLEAQARKIPAGALETADTLLQNRQLQERGFFTEVEHPVLGKLPYMGPQGRLSAVREDMTGRAPLLGEE